MEKFCPPIDGQLIRLIGAFVAAAALLLFLSACIAMFDSWDALKNYPKCIANIGSETSEIAQLQYIDCKDSLYKITGVQLKGGQDKISKTQFLSALVGPIANVFLWIAVFIIGSIIYTVPRAKRPVKVAVKEKRERKK